MGLKVENKFKKPSLYVDVETRTSGNASDRPWDDRSDLEIRYEQLKAELIDSKQQVSEYEGLYEESKRMRSEITALKSKLKIAVEALVLLESFGYITQFKYIKQALSEIGGEI